MYCTVLNNGRQTNFGHSHICLLLIWMYFLTNQKALSLRFVLFYLYLIWFDLIWFDLIWFDLILFYFILFYFILFYFILFILFYFILFYFILFYFILFCSFISFYSCFVFIGKEHITSSRKCYITKQKKDSFTWGYGVYSQMIKAHFIIMIIVKWKFSYFLCNVKYSIRQ